MDEIDDDIARADESLHLDSSDDDLEDLMFKDVEELSGGASSRHYIEDDIDGFMMASNNEEDSDVDVTPLTQRPSGQGLNSSWMREKTKPIPSHLVVLIDEDDEFYSKQTSDQYFNFKNDEADKEVEKSQALEALEIELVSTLPSWSKKELSRFYKALGRYGKHALHPIAARVKSKNVLQVRRLIYMLDSMRKLVRMRLKDDFPEAFEVSEKWIRIEEKKAAKIMRDYTNEMKEENNVFETKERFMFDTTALMKKTEAKYMHSLAYEELVSALKHWMTPIIFCAGEFAVERQKNTRDTKARTANVMLEDMVQALYQTGAVYDDGDVSDLMDEDENTSTNVKAETKDEDSASSREGRNNNNASDSDEADADRREDGSEDQDSRVNSEDLLASDDEQFAQGHED